MNQLIPIERIESKILLLRGQKVMLDRDLARLYEVPTKRLNEQVRRNIKRFPEDFMFQLTKEEVIFLRSHFATLKKGQHFTVTSLLLSLPICCLYGTFNIVNDGSYLTLLVITNW